MTIKELEIKDLIEYENNPRHNEEAVEKVAASIKEFGFKVPIIIDKDNVIIAGHTRLKAARSLGLKKAPCIVATDLTPEQVKAFRLIDNKTGELAEWNIEKIAAELQKISNIDMQQFGFDEEKTVMEDITTETETGEETALTLQLSLEEEQYQICLKVIEYWNDNITHSFGNKNKKSNALFEAVYAFAVENKIITGE